MPKKLSLTKILSVLVVLLAILNANNFLEAPLVGATPIFIVQLLFIGVVFRYKKSLCPVASDYKWINRFLIWCAIEIGLGFFIADNYIEKRQLLVGGISLMVPILAWVFYDPNRSSKIFRFFFQFAWIPYVIFFVWNLGLTQFYYSPLLLLFLFHPIFSKKQRIVVFILAAIYIISVWGDARSQSYKGIAALGFGVLLAYRFRITTKLIRCIRICCFLGFIAVFAFVLTDSFQVIIKGISVSMVENNNSSRDFDKKDTRSLLYIDVYQSSINDESVLFGKTPARGFKVKYSWVLFLSQYSYDFVFNKGERHKNEMLLSNIYTWTGLIGLILFSLIYYRGSYLAVTSSRNKILPIVGCFVAFRWMFGWIEDVNNFLIMDVDLWALIGMCYSDKFRNMSESDMIIWIKSLLNPRFLNDSTSKIC